jgi:hypothetical protein
VYSILVIVVAIADSFLARLFESLGLQGFLLELSHVGYETFFEYYWLQVLKLAESCFCLELFELGG